MCWDDLRPWWNRACFVGYATPRFLLYACFWRRENNAGSIVIWIFRLKWVPLMGHLCDTSGRNTLNMYPYIKGGGFTPVRLQIIYGWHLFFLTLTVTATPTLTQGIPSTLGQGGAREAKCALADIESAPAAPISTRRCSAHASSARGCQFHWRFEYWCWNWNQAIFSMKNVRASRGKLYCIEDYKNGNIIVVPRVTADQRINWLIAVH